MKNLLSLLMLAVLLSSGAVLAQQLPPHVAGKIVAVSHEKVKVTINNKDHWRDQVKVKVDSCTKPNTVEEVEYTPGLVSDRSELGHLLEAALWHAHHVIMNKPEPQRQMNGFGIFWIDPNNNNRVQRSGFLGNNVDCGAVPALINQFQ